MIKNGRSSKSKAKKMQLQKTWKYLKLEHAETKTYLNIFKKRDRGREEEELAALIACVFSFPKHWK